mmetsp:Transcript_9205/g.26360  ORF Transcript_9205/g.26360 Transcript_9205/m.26360 type:complete len:364 (+) Transcript_9205:179-1270(+)
MRKDIHNPYACIRLYLSGRGIERGNRSGAALCRVGLAVGATGIAIRERRRWEGIGLHMRAAGSRTPGAVGVGDAAGKRALDLLRDGARPGKGRTCLRPARGVVVLVGSFVVHRPPILPRKGLPEHTPQILNLLPLLVDKRVGDVELLDQFHHALSLRPSKLVQDPHRATAHQAGARPRAANGAEAPGSGARLHDMQLHIRLPRETSAVAAGWSGRPAAWQQAAIAPATRPVNSGEDAAAGMHGGGGPAVSGALHTIVVHHGLQLLHFRLQGGSGTRQLHVLPEKRTVLLEPLFLLALPLALHGGQAALQHGAFLLHCHVLALQLCCCRLVRLQRLCLEDIAPVQLLQCPVTVRQSPGLVRRAL